MNIQAAREELRRSRRTLHMTVEQATNNVVEAYLGDQVLYEIVDDTDREEVDAAIAFGELVQVWPKEES